MSTSKPDSEQSSGIELKTIVDDNTVSLLEAEKAIEIDSNCAVKHERRRGINIKFQDIIYRAQRNIIRDRCKCNRNCQLNFEKVKFH